MSAARARGASSGEHNRHRHRPRACAKCHDLRRVAVQTRTLAGVVVSSVPAVVIAAPASGSGKTTVATGLMGALRRAGRRVAPFKVGPDFIDPGYHALAALRPGRNLDPVLVGEQLIGPLYRHGSAGADIAVVEGVMGLFDGRISDGPAHTAVAQGSTAHVAALLGAPVILVVDTRGQSHSIAALLHGFSTFDQSVRIAGVILNRVGSPRHEEVLRQACEHAGVPVLGVIPRADELSVPSRHLGLVTAVEHGEQARAAVEAMTALVGRHVDLDGYPMCGVLSGTALFTERLTLGYREAVAVADSPLHTIGDRMTGHEFHRTTVTFADSYPPAWVYAGRDLPTVRDGAIDRGVHAGYLHTHPAAHPQAITRFVAAAATSKLAG